jgi:hypothetical protein
LTMEAAAFQQSHREYTTDSIQSNSANESAKKFVIRSSYSILR